MFSRRDVLAATAVGGVVTAATMSTADATPVKSDISFGNPNDPPQGAINAKNPRSISDPGPQNPAIRVMKDVTPSFKLRFFNDSDNDLESSNACCEPLKFCSGGRG